MKLTGSQILIKVLLEHGVDTIFGYPGGAALNIYDTLFQHRNEIRHILTAHEQGAAHAADGYARATGKTGVVIATSGPGATNLVTGIATAFMDSIPMVAITASVPGNLIGTDSFQEICITGVTMPVTKHNYFINRVEDLEDALRNAFRIANDGRKGPVLVDITKDVTVAETEFQPGEPMALKEFPKAPQAHIEQLAKLINNSKKPVICFGGGVVASRAREEVAELIHKADIPATYTMMAAGVISYDDPKNLGLIGMHGSMASNKGVDMADLVIALGTRFSDRVALNTAKFARRAAIVQIDIDRCEMNKNVEVDLTIIGDVKETLTRLLPLVENKSHCKWTKKLSKLKQTTVNTKCPRDTLHPRDIIGIACDKTDKETIYVTDVGQHQMWAAQYLKHGKTKGFLTSGGLGTMGFGYGAAIGAQVGCPHKRIIHFTGDASFHMNLNEACTAVSQKLPIITVIMNNQVLGMVYQWQSCFYNGNFSATTPERETDFVKLAEGFGAIGYRAETPEEFSRVFEKALTAKGPVWIECIISRNEQVLPMIPNGGTVEDMIVG